MQGHCGMCGKNTPICANCARCHYCCQCGLNDTFDSDELGLDPETDNTPGDESRHA